MNEVNQFSRLTQLDHKPIDNQELTEFDPDGSSNGSSSFSPELLGVINAWHDLPPAIRSAILTLVRVSNPSGKAAGLTS